MALRSFLCTCLLASQLLLAAQAVHPMLRHYSAKDGLPSSEVYDIMQDQQGYIWVSTDNGIARFNGYQFETFGPDDGLSDPVVFHLFEDHRGWIWMYSFKDKIFIYRDGGIHLFPHSDLIKSFRATDNPSGVDWIHVDRQGDLYASVSGYGIVKITEDGGCTDITADVPAGIVLWTHEEYHFTGFKSYAYFSPTAEDHEYYQLPRDQFGVITIMKAGGPDSVLVKPRKRYPESTANLFHKNNARQPALPRIPLQFNDRLEVLDISTGQTLQYIPYTTGTIINWLSSKKGPLTFLGHDYADRGLSIFDRSDYLDHLDVLREPRLRMLQGTTITHLLEDHQGGLWIGTLKDGIYYLPKPDLALGFFDDPRLSTPRSIAMAPGDTTWIRTQDHEVYLIDGNDYLHLVPQEKHFGNGYKLLWNNERNLLLADGLVKYWSPKIQSWTFVMRDGFATRPTALKYHNQSLEIKASEQQPDQYWLLFLTAYSKLDLSTEVPVRGPDYSLSPRQRIFSILETKSGNVFLGGMEGLYQLETDSTSKQIIHHPALYNRIEDLAEMPDGSLVVGTKGGGIVLWAADSTRQINVTQGLTSSAVEQIHIDQKQQIWVGTNEGLNRIRLRNDSLPLVETMTYADGLPSNEITDIHSRGNILWVATQEGLLHFSIDIAFNNGPISPVIEQIKVNGIICDQDYLKQLTWVEDNIQITVASLDFPQAGKVTYRYRFAADASWQKTQSPRIEVARLSPGDYEFEIQARGRNGLWSPALSFPLHLQNPFWLSIWFWTGLVAVLALIGILFYARELRRQSVQQRQEKQLLQLEREISDLQQQAYRAQMNPHFVYNCLTAIQSYMLSNQDDQLLASDYLSKFALLTRQALEASRKKTVSLAKDVEMLDNYIQLEQFRFGHRFSYSIEVAPGVAAHEIHIPALLVQPYVENAILHGLNQQEYPGKLQISYRKKGNFLHISIQDNGPGIFQHQNGKLKMQDRTKHESAGMDIARKRIIGTSQKAAQAQVKIEELRHENGTINGTLVEVLIPLHSF